MKRGKPARLGLLTRPIRSAERPDWPDSWPMTPKDASAKANPPTNGADPDNDTVELSYGASS